MHSKQISTAPIATDLVLLGGGHSHLFVLRHFAMNPLPGLRLTLVSRDLHTPYSGMLPGYIAGHYDFDQTHIDLLPLARFAGARVIHDEVIGLDADRRRLQFAGRPALDYDLLSINIGSRPVTPALGDAEFAVKPVDRFLFALGELERRLAEESARPARLALVGGGAGSVEVALALDYRFNRARAAGAGLHLGIVTREQRLLSGHNAGVRRRFERILDERGIDVHYRHRVERFENGALRGDFAEPVAADAVIWATQAGAAGWLRQSGLELDEGGFVAVSAALQSRSHDNVFAAGDIAAVLAHPRPKSGVFAVRQGLPLARNLRRRAQGREVRPFRPQRQFLSLISTGDPHAVLSRGPFALEGRWCWWLKDRIDRAFVRRFSELPTMTDAAGDDVDLAPMHCGGCGSKIGDHVLRRALERVDRRHPFLGESGFGHVEDAALLDPPAGARLLQSVDFFRSFIDDPYLFGRIAANHALGDLFAMGVDAHSAQVLANVVYASAERQQEDLFQLMAGVVETLAAHDTRLLGGHSGEAAQMSCGLTVNGFAPSAATLMLKSGLRVGDRLVLCKALGSGVLFAAEMRGAARGEWIDRALAVMLQSSRAAAFCLRRHGALACTDITGFGLAGHLYEMLEASAVSADIALARVPLLDGAAELAGAGIASSLQPQNIRLRHRIADAAGLSASPVYPLLFDPQTAGGLLAGVPDASLDACVAALRELGYGAACAIGRVTPGDGPAPSIRLVQG